jgi:hypothetical protein
MFTFALIQQCYQPVFDYTGQVPKTKMQTHSNSPAKKKIPNNQLNAQDFETNENHTNGLSRLEIENSNKKVTSCLPLLRGFSRTLEYCLILPTPIMFF